MKKLKLLLGLLFSVLFLSEGWANAPAFTVSGLQRFNGLSLSVYYVSGRPASLGTPGQEIHVNKVMSGPHVYRISGDQVSIGKVNVPRDGWTSFNYVIFVVHQQASHALTNLSWSNGGINREPVRYHDDSVNVSYTNSTQSYVLKAYRTSRQISPGSDVRL